MAETMEMSPLERAARAAADAAEWDYDDVPFLTESIVRAVLQALREPSDRMMSAGYIVSEHLAFIGDAAVRKEMERIWQAMVDRALSELPSKQP